MRGKHVSRAGSGAARRLQRAALGQAEGSGEQCGDFSKNRGLVMSAVQGMQRVYQGSMLRPSSRPAALRA